MTSVKKAYIFFIYVIAHLIRSVTIEPETSLMFITPHPVCDTDVRKYDRVDKKMLRNKCYPSFRLLNSISHHSFQFPPRSRAFPAARVNRRNDMWSVALPLASYYPSLL